MKPSTAILTWLLLGSIGTLAAIVTVRCLVRGEYPSALVALGGSAFCFGLVTPLAKVVRRKQAPSVEVDATGTIFRPDRGIDIPMQVSLVGGIGASVLIAVLAPLDKLAIPVPPFMRFSLPFMSVVIVALGAPMLWRNVSRGGATKYLGMTRNGFDISEGLRSHSGDWEDVRDITDQVPGKPVSTSGPIVFVMADDSTPTIAASGMTPDGTALRELARFYWEHPEARDELTDGRAVERLTRSLA